MDNEDLSLLEQIAERPNVEAETIHALHLEQFLKALWPEVCALSPRQRWAFLLHLEKDELLAFIQHGCCSLARIAEVLAVSPEQFVAWFRELPWPDDRIAERLGLTRRQVINLRKCARERLGRRLKVFGSPP